MCKSYFYYQTLLESNRKKKKKNMEYNNSLLIFGYTDRILQQIYHISLKSTSASESRRNITESSHFLHISFTKIIKVFYVYFPLPKPASQSYKTKNFCFFQTKSDFHIFSLFISSLTKSASTSPQIFFPCISPL